MKKLLALVLALTMVLALAACAKNTGTNTGTVDTNGAAATTAPADNGATETENAGSETENTPAVMTYAEYIAAELDSAVTVETYVQAKQSWWDNKANLYTQNEDGAIFIYETACSEEDFAKLTEGTKIRVSGYKSQWSGEVEIIDGSFEILDGSYIAEPLDVTDLLGTDALIEKQNQKVAFTGMTVESAAQYKWDGSGSEGDDLYFNVSVNGATYSFTVESYLCDKTTQVYQDVKNLKVGDVVNMEGFLYWYEGANPHITSVTVTAAAPAVMSYAEYVAAELDTPVVVETYVQAKQSWWDNKANLYTQNEDGAIFVYETVCSEEDFAKLVEGTKIRVTGYKSQWSGEVEIIDGSFEILDGSYVAEPLDVTDLLGTDSLIEKQNQKVAFTGMTVESAAQYKWDGSGSEGDDLYFDVSVNGTTYTFTVESYLCDSTTEVYQAVKNLQPGQVIDMEGFLYWYEGVNPHITAVTVIMDATPAA